MEGWPEWWIGAGVEWQRISFCNVDRQETGSRKLNMSSLPRRTNRDVDILKNKKGAVIVIKVW